MKKTKTAAVILSAIALSTVVTGCGPIETVSAEPFVISGSKSDAAVNVVYKTGLSVIGTPGIDGRAVRYTAATESSMVSLAIERCKKWGYKGAESFGGQTSKCVSPTEYGCDGEEVTVVYACTE